MFAPTAIDAWKLTSLVTAGLALCLVAGVFLLRLRRGLVDRRRRRLVALWRPILAQSLVEPLPPLPRIRPGDRFLFLSLWTHMRESIKGESAEELCTIARQTCMDQVARHYLVHGTLRQQLLAIVMLGHLKDHTVWDHLVMLAQHANTVRSLEAARAMVRIDAVRAIPLLIPLIAHRHDWSPLRVLNVLETAGPALVSRTLGKAAQQASPPIAARLIRYLAMTYSSEALPLIRPLLTLQPLDEDLLASCLFLFGQCADPLDLPTVRQYLTHPTWFIRVHAASALGRMGVEEDEARLVNLLDDPQWWVRYRAAEALSALPSMTESKLEGLVRTLPTPQARSVLIPLLAKRRVAVIASSTTVSAIAPPSTASEDPANPTGTR